MALSGSLCFILLGPQGCLKSTRITPSIFQFQQIRYNNWPDWRMKKDHRKRQTVIQFSAERDRVNTIKKNDILPRELREIAAGEVAALPRDSNYIRLVNRCAITSRPKGCVKRWRLSRIMFRLLADYNKLSGVQRALW